MAKTKREKTMMRARRRKRTARAMYDEYRSEVIHNVDMPKLEEVREVVRAARARHMQMQASAAMDEPMMGEEAGRALSIGAVNEHEAGQLWETFKLIDASDDAFCRRVLNRPRFANGARLELLPDRMETRPDDRIDIRTPDEKAADAKRAWSGWLDILGGLQSHLCAALHMGLRQRVKLHQGRNLTGAGGLFVEAMRQVDTAYRAGIDARRKVR
mgnify:CR=1 FL=1